MNYKVLQSKKTHQLPVDTDYDANSLHENTDIIKKTKKIYYSLKMMLISVKADKSREQVKYFVQEEIKCTLNKDICCYLSFQNIFCSRLVSKTQILKYKKT